MAKHKKKIIHNVEVYEMQKRIGRIIGAKPTVFHKDKSKYNRRVKYKEVHNDDM